MTSEPTRLGPRGRGGRRSKKHLLLLLGFTALTLSAAVPRAQAFVCARGVYRAGCVGPNGGVVVRRPYSGGYYHPYLYRRPYWRGAVRVYR
jgi:hypothetical protein